MLAIRHDSTAQRFTADIDGATAYISYRATPGRVLDLHHTYVPRAARGGGIASQLTAHVLMFARDEGYKVVPSCPFVAAYIDRHAEYRDLLA
ncbi:MAG TPA: GNAT family N-acetyltransferase [Gammaproteobacteria bacterium]|nr:GNAT family N-acetyltransferase [Gammaproteobacteria bacterium]